MVNARIKVRFFCFLILFTFLLTNTSLGFESIKHPGWIYEYQNYAYGHWEWFKEVNLEKWIKTLSSKGANVLVMGQIPSKNGNYDWIKKASCLAHKYNMKLLLYVNFNRVPAIPYDKLEWHAVNWKGKVVQVGDMCSDYRRYILNLLLDLEKKYKFDGYVIDMFFSGVPHGSRSKACINLFLAKYKYDVPPNYMDIRTMSSKFLDWIQFHVKLREDFLRILTKKAHKINPNFAIIVNQTGGWKFDIGYNNFLSVNVADYVDGIMEEEGWEYRLRNVPRRMRVKYIFQNKFLAKRKGKGISIIWYLTYPEPEAEIRYKMLNALVHGNIPVFTVGSNIDIMPSLWETINSMRSNFLKKGIASNNPVALVFSEKTLWYFKPTKKGNVYPYIANMYGFTQMLLDEYIPFDIITDKNLGREDFKNYKLIILPNTVVLEDKELKAIGEFIKSGGIAIITGISGKYDGNLRLRKELPEFLPVKVYKRDFYIEKGIWLFSPEDIESIKFLRDRVFQYYKQWRQGRFSSLNYIPILPKTFEFNILLTVSELRNTDIIRVGSFLGKLNKLRRVKSCAFVISSYGKGKVIYFPYDIGSIYYQNSFPPISRLVACLIRKYIHVKSYNFNGYPVEVNYLTVDGKKYVSFFSHMIDYGFGDSPNVSGYNYIRNYMPILNFNRFYKVQIEGNER